MRAAFSFRLYVIGALACLIALVLIGRLYMVQIVKGETYREEAAGQYVETKEGLYDRGSIFFKHKEGGVVSAATLKSGFTIAINPSRLVEIERAEKELVSLIPDFDVDAYRASAQKSTDPYEVVVESASEEAGQAIDALNIRGLDAYRERWRYYPGESLAAHTIGFVAYDDADDRTGRYGLERTYNDTLTRQSATLYVNFFAEVFADLNRTLFTSEAKREGDVVTTIEPSVQLYLESVLKEVDAKWKSKTTGGIILDPKTGEIFALAATPSFDVNTFASEVSAGVYSNPLVENVYEFGSIMKPLTMAAALDSGAITAETTYVDNGSATYDGKTISNFDGRARGRVPMQEVLSQSLNTGVAFAVEKMGTDTFKSYMDAYGITSETGIDLPNEASPLVKNLESPRMIEYVTASYGQGVAISPIAMARSLATLAAGAPPTPHVVSDIQYTSGLTKHMAWESGPAALKPETQQEISRMLVEVVDKALLKGKAKQDRYTIAAKTGTAQMADPGGGGYYADRYLHSFFGYFPAYDAKFLVFLFTVEPQGVNYASETLTHPFLDLTKFLISYYELPPDR